MTEGTLQRFHRTGDILAT